MGWDREQGGGKMLVLFTLLGLYFSQSLLYTAGEHKHHIWPFQEAPEVEQQFNKLAY